MLNEFAEKIVVHECDRKGNHYSPKWENTQIQCLAIQTPDNERAKQMFERNRAKKV